MTAVRCLFVKVISVVCVCIAGLGGGKVTAFLILFVEQLSHAILLFINTYLFSSTTNDRKIQYVLLRLTMCLKRLTVAAFLCLTKRNQMVTIFYNQGVFAVLVATPVTTFGFRELKSYTIKMKWLYCFIIDQILWIIIYSVYNIISLIFPQSRLYKNV